MRQRAMVAMAILLTPELMIMDEPTSALDVVAQQALMTQVKELQRTFGFAVVFVTHDMSLVARYSDRVAVMYAGQIVELLDTPRLFSAHHPYSALLASFPSIAPSRRRLVGIPGNPPDLSSPPPGCRFNPRCGAVMPMCRGGAPAAAGVARAARVRCLLYDDTCETEWRLTCRSSGRRPLQAFPAAARLLASRLHAVDDVTSPSQRGEIVAVVGESGWGKSTLARLLAL